MNESRERGRRPGGAWTRRDFLRGGLGAAAAVGLGGCATNPVTGRRQLMLMSSDDEIRLDRQHAPHQFSSDYGAMPDASLNAYIQEVGLSLAARTHRPHMPYTFRGVQASYLNAYAFPGGSIAVTRGLLLAMDNEAQLAALLGHELGHVNARHTAQRMTSAVLAQVVVIGLAAAAAKKKEEYGGLVLGLGGIGAGLLLARYSRADERQADELGMRYAAAAGYPPSGMVELMDILRRESKSRPNVLEQMFASHPMSEERFQTARRRAQEARFAEALGYPDRRERYLDRLAGLRARKPAVEAIQRGDRELARKQPAAAAERYAAALAVAPDDYEALLKLAKCRLLEKRLGDALRLAETARQACPDEPHARHVRGFALLELRRYDAALADFMEYERRLAGNPVTTFFLGRAYDGLGRRSDAIAHYRKFLATGAEGDFADHARRRLTEWGVAPG